MRTIPHAMRQVVTSPRLHTIAARQQLLGQHPSEAGGRAGDEPAFRHVNLTLLVNRQQGGT